MISFPLAGGCFTHRAVGVCVDDGYVLLHRSVNDDFWSLPGGRIELGEASLQAIVREMREELGLDAHTERLLWIVENFFTYGDVSHHELGMYYLISFQHDAPIYDKTHVHEGLEDIELRLLFRWFPLETLANVHLFPTFLRVGLRELPLYPTHIVHTDGDE
ncbi:MAG: NUDIX hydrolase [Ktedonobacterales bacterium]